MNPDLKSWIDNASYVELLSKWRFAELGDPLFQGEIGDYYQQVMNEKRKMVDHVAASKLVGWDDKYAKEKFNN